MAKAKITIDTLISIDDNGMPIAPNLRQLVDKDVRELYTRDKSTDKKRYVQECIVIYYLGDPKSPARQSGLSDVECLRMAIEQADLKKDYIPDVLVLRLIKRYYEQNIGEAGIVVENIIKTLHNTNLAVTAMNRILNEKLNTGLNESDLPNVLGMMANVSKIAGDLPGIFKKLEEAKQNLMYEIETETARGGGAVTSSMDAEEYIK